MGRLETSRGLCARFWACRGSNRLRVFKSLALESWAGRSRRLAGVWGEQCGLAGPSVGKVRDLLCPPTAEGDCTFCSSECEICGDRYGWL